MDIAPTSDEKVMAALAHGSVLFAFFGPIVPAIIWITQRKKSKYVCFHALQAMGYQAFTFWLWMVVMILIVVTTMCLVLPLSMSMAQDAQNAPAGLLSVQFLVFLWIFGMMGLFFLTAIIAAVFCLLGRHFRYPWIGKWLEQHLPYKIDAELQIDEAQEENWVAGVCHATAILQLWGVVTPLIVWFTQKERSARLRFQSMQALVYQGIALVTYLAGMVLYMLAFFGMFFILAAAGTMSEGGRIEGPVGALMAVFFGAIMLIWLVVMILMPVYYLLAGIASLRVIQGHPFRYPILGRIIEKRMETSRKLEPVR